MHPQWVRELRDQCVAAGVPFLFKQWGEWRPVDVDRETDWRYKHGCYVSLDGTVVDWPGSWHISEGAVAAVRVGKKAAGRDLDGRTWDEFPS
jgi:protein gp37